MSVGKFVIARSSETTLARPGSRRIPKVGMDDVFRAIAWRQSCVGKGPKGWEYDEAAGRRRNRNVQVGKECLTAATCVQIKDRGDEATGGGMVHHIDMRREFVAPIR